jgi:O-antigen/teichoic acid export membrane protein
MSRTRWIARAVLSDYILWGTTVVSGFVLAPFLIRYLHPEGYGLWAIYASLLGYMGLIDLGLGPTTATQVAQFHVHGQSRLLDVWVSNILVVYLPLMLLVLAASAAIAPFAGHVFHVSSALLPSASSAFLAACVGLAVALPRSMLRGLIVGYQRTEVANLVDAAFALAAAGAMIVSAVKGAGLLGVTVAGAGVSLLQTLLTAWLVRRLFPGISLIPKFSRPDLIVRALRSSLPIAAVFVTAQVVFRTDNIVIGLFRGPNAVASYAVAYALVWFGLNLVFKLSDSLLPLFSGMQAGGEHDALRHTYVESARLSLALAMCLTLGLLAFGKTAIAIWVGPQFFVGTPTLVVLALLPTVHAVTHVASILLIGLGRARAIALMSVPDALLNLALSVVLMRWIGVVGVALGTVVGELATTFWYLPVLCNRELSLSGWAFFSRVWARPLLSLPPAAAVAWTVQMAFGRWPPAVVLLIGAATTAAAYFGTYFLFSTPQERGTFRTAIRGLWATPHAIPASGEAPPH